MILPCEQVSVQRRLREKRLKRSVEQSAAAELLQSAATGLGWGRRRGPTSKAAAASTRRRAFSSPMSFGTKGSDQDCIASGSTSGCADHVAVVRLVDWDTAQDTVHTHLRRLVLWS